MKGAPLGAKYLVSSGNTDQIVTVSCSGSSARRQGNIAPTCGLPLIPRCWAYHSYILFGSLALKKIPPSPMTLFVNSLIRAVLLRFSDSQMPDVQMFRCSDVQMFRCSDVQMFRCSDVQMFRCSDVQMFRCSDVQMFRSSDSPCLRGEIVILTAPAGFSPAPLLMSSHKSAAWQSPACPDTYKSVPDGGFHAPPSPAAISIS